MKTIFEITFIGILGIIFGFFILQGLERQEVVDCLKLEKQSKDFSQFYLTTWEDEMCRSHDIIINAPVK